MEEVIFIEIEIQIIASSHLHYRPVVWLAQQLDDSWDAIVQSHCILGQLGILVARREVAQGTHGWLSNILFLPRTKHSMDQRFNPPTLSYQHLRKRGGIEMYVATCQFNTAQKFIWIEGTTIKLIENNKYVNWK